MITTLKKNLSLALTALGSLRSTFGVLTANLKPRLAAWGFHLEKQKRKEKKKDVRRHLEQDGNSSFKTQNVAKNLDF